MILDQKRHERSRPQKATLVTFDERHRVAGDAFAATCETKTIGSSGFDAYLPGIQAQMLRQVDTHGRYVGGKPGFFSDDSGINITYFPMMLT